MMDYIREHRGITCLLIDDVDRFSREDTLDVFNSIRDLVSWGVQWIHSVNDGSFHIADQNDGLMHSLLAKTQSAAEASRKTGRRIAAAKRGDIDNGRRPGGPIPFGMRSVSTGVLAPGDKGEQRLVLEIYARFADGDSYGAIATGLNERGVPAPLGASGLAPPSSGF
jgi:hypothetical protein